MPSPDVLDFAKLLAPLSGDKKTGTDLRADSSPTSPYYAIKDARSTARAAERAQVTEEAGAEKPLPPDWRPVSTHGVKVLAEKSKDLEIAAYLIEAQIRINGFAGLRDGFRLARELVEKYWDGLFPVLDEDGPERRLSALIGLNGDESEGTLIVPIAKVPITENTNFGRLSAASYHEAMTVNKTADPKLKEKKIAAGALSMENFQKAVAETPPKFFATLVDDLTASMQEFDKLNAALTQRCGDKAPPSSNIKSALVAVLDIIKDQARAQLEKAAMEAQAKADGGATSAKEGAPKDGPQQANGAPVQPGVIRTREDAFTALTKAADYFRKAEPHSPVSYALEQAVRWGKMPLPELLAELIPDEAPRKSLFKQVGIKTSEPPAKEASAKK